MTILVHNSLLITRHDRETSKAHDTISKFIAEEKIRIIRCNYHDAPSAIIMCMSSSSLGNCTIYIYIYIYVTGQTGESPSSLTAWTRCLFIPYCSNLIGQLWVF